MHTDRQLLFLMKRFEFNPEKVQTYLKDLCSKNTVIELAKKHSTNPIQIQRDRNNFVQKSISPKTLKKIKHIL
jgi:hypothetical protein